MNIARKSINLLSKSLGDLKDSLNTQTDTASKTDTASTQSPLRSSRSLPRLYPSELCVENVAGEALLQQLEPGYYVAGFDAVSYELFQLSQDTEPLVVESIAERRTAVLEVVGGLLTRHVLMHYAQFVLGIDDLADLEAEIQTAYDLVKKTRSLLSSSKADVKASLSIARDSTSKRMLVDILGIADRLQMTRDLHKQVRSDSQNGDFAQALWLCAQGFAWMQQLANLPVAKDLTVSVDHLFSEVTGLLQKALQAACASFASQPFEKVLEGIIFLGSAVNLSSEIAAAFTAAIDERVVSCMRHAILNQPEMVLKAKTCITLHDWVKVLPPRDFCVYLGEVLAILFDIMTSHYGMARFCQSGLAAWKKRLSISQARKAEVKRALQLLGSPAAENSHKNPSISGEAAAGLLDAFDSGKDASKPEQSVSSRTSILPQVSLHVFAGGQQTRRPDPASAMPTAREPLLTRLQELEDEEQEAMGWGEALAAVQRGLSGSTRLLLEDAARKLHVLLSQPAASHKDRVMQVLQWCHRFLVAGEAFSGCSDRGGLKDQLATIAYAHYRSMHAANLEGLCSLLGRENWRPVPILPGGSLLLEMIEAAKQAAHIGQAGFEGWASQPNPWRQAEEAQQRQQLGVAVLPLVRGGSVPSAAKDLPAEAEKAIFTAACNQARLWMSDYASMLRVMQPAAVLVTGIFELFDLYLVVVFRDFSDSISLSSFVTDSASQVLAQDAVSERLKRTLHRILNQSLQALRPQLLAGQSAAGRAALSAAPVPGQPGPRTKAVAAPSSQSRVLAVEPSKISHSGNLWGLQERLTAAKSLLALAQELRAARRPLQSLLSTNQAAALEAVYSRTVEASGDVVDCIVRAGARLNLAISHLPDSIAEHDYNMSEPPEASASWVEDLCSQAALLRERLEHVPDFEQAIAVQLWRHAARYMTEVMLDGLSRVGACTAIGRSAMASDLQDLWYSLKTLLQPLGAEMEAALDSNLRLVDGYIKAFFLGSGGEVQRWVQTHQEYTQRQIMALAGTMADFRGLKRKERAAFMGQVQTWLTSE